MFDEEKARNDIEKMRRAYDEAIKEIDEVLSRQKEIADKIYRFKQKKESNT